MVKGKSTCKLLKDIRQQIADANGISYQLRSVITREIVQVLALLVRRRYVIWNVS